MTGKVKPEDLMDLAREFPDAVEPMILYNAADSLAARGAEGFEIISDYPAGKHRDTIILDFASRLASNDPKAAWDLAKKLPEEDQKKFLSPAVRRELAKIAPRELAEYTLAQGADSSRAITGVIDTWAEKEPRGAFDWSSQNLEGRPLSDSLSRSLNQWVKTDPSSAATAANTLAPGMRAKLLPGMLTSWGGTDPQAAFAFANQLPEIDRLKADDGVIRGWAYKDPQAAAAVLASLPVEGMDRSYDAIARKLGETDPASAMTWAGGIADAKKREEMARDVTRNLSDKDAAAASKQLDGLSPGPFRDNAIAGFVDSVSDLDPESAAVWAGSIQKKELRNDSVRTSIKNWYSKDPGAARAFVNTMSPGALKDEMSKLVEK
jgi:hypothetical protein